jgi:hypothetical protein
MSLILNELNHTDGIGLNERSKRAKFAVEWLRVMTDELRAVIYNPAESKGE